MSLRVYNTLTRRLEPFEPIEPPRVGMYVCGPTVYGHPHLGHAKSYVSFDAILRWLRHGPHLPDTQAPGGYRGYDVTYVQNITDVGHLTEDTVGMADEGEDKIVAEARRRRLHPMAVAELYTRSYFEDMDALNVLRPDICPRASGHIPEQIELVEQLIAKGHAYVVNGSVYFDVHSFPDYGRLSGRRVEELEAGARVRINEEKRHPADFALWKRAEPGHIMQWPSPWGRGYPGWHLECSVMSMKYLGPTFEIHGGGLENQFPHHECEIAQSVCATGQPFVKYWLHNNMVTVDGQKMGKSLGNFVTLKELFRGEHPRLTRGYEPLVVRLFVLTSHYRSTLDFSEAALQAARSGYERLRSAVVALRSAIPQAPAGDAPPRLLEQLDELRRRFTEAMNDDFNTSAAVAALFDLVRVSNTALTQGVPRAGLLAAECLFRELGGEILGLVPDVYPEEHGATSETLDNVVRILIDLRNEARARKDFALADAIRERLAAVGITLTDTREGTRWERRR